MKFAQGTAEVIAAIRDADDAAAGLPSPGVRRDGGRHAPRDLASGIGWSVHRSTVYERGGQYAYPVSDKLAAALSNLPAQAAAAVANRAELDPVDRTRLDALDDSWRG